MNARINNRKATLRRTLRQQGAIINARDKTIQVDRYELSRKDLSRLEELESWGYRVLPEEKTDNQEQEYTETFVGFADEILAIWKDRSY